MSENKVQVAGDRPIASIDEDKLSRVPFVQALAKQLAGANAADSMVFALYGPWGSGKTSILNMVEEMLSKQGDTLILRFNPWLFSGTEQLVGHFFHDLAAQLLEKDAKKYENVAKALEGYGVLVGPLGALPVVGPWVKATTGASDMLAKALKKKAQALPGSVESQRKQLVASLSKLDKRVVVLVDDIDRLRQEEIRDVMRLVRLVADFPNTQYLLAFDRARVVEALSGAEGDGQAYLEKIVQAAFDIPQTAEPDLGAMLADVVNAILQEKSYRYENADVDNIFHLVIRPLFSTAREVRRFSNCLPFAFEIMGDEIAAPDLLALEAMRTVHPGVMEKLASMVDVLTRVSGSYNGYSNEEKQSSKQAINSLVGLAGRHEPVVKEWLRRLFPPTRAFTENYIFGSESQKGWRRDRRVAHPEVLRFYLEKRLPDNALPTSYIRAVFESLGDKLKLTKLLEPLDAQALETMLARIEDYENDYPANVVQPALEVFSDLVERLREGQRGFGDPFGASLALSRVLFRLVRRAGPPPKPFEVIDRALLGVRSLSARALLISLVGTEQEEVEIGTSADRQRLLTVLGRQVVMASKDKLRNERRLERLLQLAKTNGNAGDAFFEDVLGDDEILLRFLSSSLSESFAMTLGDVAQRKTEDIPWKEMQELVGPEVLRRRVLALAAKSLNITDMRKRVAFALAVNYAKGA